MKRFLYKTILLVIPIIAIFIVAEYLIRNIPNDYSYKNEYLKRNVQNIETLFLGSSHAFYGINPAYFSGNSFNASHISQTVDLDYEIIKKYSNQYKNLEYIVIPIDYFSLFNRTSTGIESWRMKNYNIYYDLSTSLAPKDNFELFAFSLKKNVKRITEYYFEKKDNISCSKLGYGNVERKQADLFKTGKTAASRHTTSNKEYLSESIAIIDKIIDFSIQNDLTILFYTSPAFYTYRNNLDSGQYQVTINTIDSISNKNKNIHYVNLISDSSFTKNDFRDADHLNKTGAKKLTKKIDEIIKNIQLRHGR